LANQEQDPILRVENVYKGFGGLMAVNGVSFEVPKGKITGLIGPNGAGKTTTFNIVSGFYKPDKGQVYFKGEPIGGLPPHKIFHKGLCRTFQVSRELKLMTVLENLMLVPPNQKGENLLYSWVMPNVVRAQEREIREKALDVLEFVGLARLKDEYAANLSGGQKRLLELARTMMADPDMILLDEPGAGVNPSLMKQLVVYIQRIAEERGVTIFLIEHDMDLVMNTCEKVIVMSSGSKLAEGTPDEVRSNRDVLEAYLGGQYR
jgi:branched-chain amino acid transport system ATP-binding protein